MMIIIEIIKATKNKSRGEQNNFEMKNKSSSPIQDKKKFMQKKSSIIFYRIYTEYTYEFYKENGYLFFIHYIVI